MFRFIGRGRRGLSVGAALVIALTSFATFGTTGAGAATGSTQTTLTKSALTQIKLVTGRTEPTDPAPVAPIIVPKVVCQFTNIKSDSRRIVFTYANNTNPNRDGSGFGTIIPPGASNKFDTVTLTKKGLVSTSDANRGQVGVFEDLPPAAAFAIDIPYNAATTWSIVTSDTTVNQTGSPQNDPARWSVKVTPLLPPSCPSSTPKNYAVPQFTGGTPLLSATPVNQGLDSSGLLRDATVRWSANATSACTVGGTPLAPKVLFGFRTNEENLDPIAPADVVRTDTFFVDANPPGEQFVRTENGLRRITDPQRPPRSSDEYGTGIAQTFVLSDVTARCQFGATVVQAPTPTFVPFGGDSRRFLLVTDTGGQFTRPPVSTACTVIGSIPEVQFCDFTGGGIRRR